MPQYEDGHERAKRAARNQVLFRDVNERVKDVNDHFQSFTTLQEWVCECANDTCTEHIEMSCDDYEKIREGAERFFVAPSEDHIWPDVEAVIERRDAYWIVEKSGLAAEIAKDQDPRSEGPLPLQT
jgi:hypothetical protein